MNIVVNGRPREVAEALRPVQLLEQLAVGREGVAVLVNGEVVAREGLEQTELHDGDQVEVVRMVGGG